MKLKDAATGRFIVTHGRTFSAEYQVWGNMIDRCENPNSAQWSRYGKRGIKVCARWRNSFLAFLRDIGPRPSTGYSIERINNSGSYFPGNVKWASPIEQAQNRGPTRILVVDGRQQTIRQWSAETGIKFRVIQKRIDRGWLPDRAVKEPRRDYPEII